MREDTTMIPVTVSVMPSDPARSYWDSRAAFYATRVAVAQQYEDVVREFMKNSAEDRKKYWESPLGTQYGDNLAARLEMAENLIERLVGRIDELEELAPLVGDAASAARQGGVSEEQTQLVASALGRLEAALRARSAAALP